VTDTVVQYWPGSGAVQNFGKAATGVALTATHVAAIVSEAGEGGGSLNSDIGSERRRRRGALRERRRVDERRQAADQLLACGSVFAFLTPEAARTRRRSTATATRSIASSGSTSRRPDAHRHRARRRPSSSATTDRRVPDERARAGRAESPHGLGNGQRLQCTYVMQGYDLARPECLTPGHPADCLVNSHRSARVCDLEACDPRVPYRLIGTGVKFIAHECEQRGPLADNCEFGGADSTATCADGDLVLLVFDVHAGTVNLVGSVSGRRSAPGRRGRRRYRGRSW
jgi:hypothetical protein